MKAIEDFYDHLECPTVDGIIFPDGKVQLLHIEVRYRPITSYSISKSVITSIEQLEREDNLRLNHCGIVCTLLNPELSIIAVCGEAAWGSDGFVAVLNAKNNKLIWLAFFTESNPFHKLEFAGNHLLATSTLDCIWSFSLENPMEISVKSQG